MYGDKWQDLGIEVSTDEGPQVATKFFVNGEEPTRRIVTEGGYRLQGTLAHRVKVVDPHTGQWVWKRLADIEPGDLVPLQLGQAVGEPRVVPLPVLDQAYYAGDRRTEVPNAVDAALAELVGYFMGDGSLHAKGIRLCVADADVDVVERIRVLSKGLFALDPVVGRSRAIRRSPCSPSGWPGGGRPPASPRICRELTTAARAGRRACPRRSARPTTRRSTPPSCGVCSRPTEPLSAACPMCRPRRRHSPTTSARCCSRSASPRPPGTPSAAGAARSIQVRVRNLTHALGFAARVGFLGGRKQALVDAAAATQSGNRDRIQLPDEVWLELAPVGHELRSLIQQAVARGRGVSRDLALQLQQVVADPRLAHALGYVFEPVAANVDGGVQPTYDLSVPSNVTYVAGRVRQPQHHRSDDGL